MRLSRRSIRWIVVCTGGHVWDICDGIYVMKLNEETDEEEPLPGRDIFAFDI